MAGGLQMLIERMTAQQPQSAGLNALVQETATEAQDDYRRLTDSTRARQPEIQKASDELAATYMQGYDPNAYDAQAWSQAGIGAATPTISALESLNRAVAGYSGVKLQQRADFSKRLGQQKQQDLMQKQYIQQQELESKKSALDKIMDLYKTQQVSRNDVLKFINDNYVNVSGRGLVSKADAAMGSDNPVVVPSLQPSIMFQKLVEDVSKEAEQDKNLHFKSTEERDAWINETAKKRWGQISRTSGNVLPANPFGIDPTQPIPGLTPPPASPLPASGNVQVKGGYIPMDNITIDPNTPMPSLSKPVEAKHMELLPGERENIDNPENPNMQIKPIEGYGVKTAGDPANATPLPTVAKPTPWAQYLAEPVPQASAPAGQGQIFDKVGQERQVAQNAAAEKNAEDMYKTISEQAESTAGWYDTLRELDQTDLSATGSFANVRNAAGKLLETMGYENAGAAKDAKVLSKVNNLLMQGIQARLSLQNGVQARDDATRETQSFAQITDPKNVFKGLIAQAKAKSLRMLEKEEFWRNWKEQKGTYNGATTAWTKYIKETPLFAMYGGKPVYYNQFVDGFMARNAKAFEKQGLSEQERMDEAIKAWRKVANPK